ncbi:MAG: AraC family transcriptional regulator, partial [Gemmatimonadaceae bacterium]|nr:AraC family transcriptional regulator [Acetobacteraceae bacterium]
MTEDLKRAVWRYADGHPDGLVETPIPGIQLMRVHAPSGLMRSMYHPVLCLVLQGAKDVMAGPTLHQFAAGQTLVVGVDQPIVGRIVRATAAEPYLALALDLDMGVIRDVMGHVAEPPGAPPHHDAVFTEDTRDAVADCALRLMRLLDRPAGVPVLLPSIVREMHYWLLAGWHGAAL